MQGHTPETLPAADGETGLAAAVAPEDLRRGDFVALLSVLHEYPSFFWCCDSSMAAREEPVRPQPTGTGDAAPLKIKAICLPFVFVKDTTGKYHTLDVRLCRFARLSVEYGRKVWRTPRQQARVVEQAR
jgi:hypothetical protein